jgi:hypothetical protein
MPPVLEPFPVADGGHEGRSGEKSYSRDCSQASDRIVRFAQTFNNGLGPRDSSIDLLEMLVQIRDQLARNGGQTVSGVCQQIRQIAPHCCRTERENETVLIEQSPQAIDHSCSFADKSLAHAVRRLQILLLETLGKHKSHVRPTNCLADRFRIRLIVLLALHVRLDVLRAHHANRVSKLLQFSSPVLCTSACLDSYQARRQLRGYRQKLRTPNLLA